MEKKKKILVVEDNNFVRMQISTFLQEDGYDVVEATNGDQALTYLGDNVCMAVVDVRMEPMGGFEFISFMQEDGYDIPVILVTGDQSHDLLSKAGQYGVSTVLLKPVQKDRLLSMTQRLMEKQNAT